MPFGAALPPADIVSDSDAQLGVLFLKGGCCIAVPPPQFQPGQSLNSPSGPFAQHIQPQYRFFWLNAQVLLGSVET